MINWNEDKIICFDIETIGDDPAYGLQPWRVAQNKASISSYAALHQGKMRGSLNPTRDDLKRMLDYAAANDITILGWNVCFDISWLIAYGFADEVNKINWLDGMLLWKHATITPEYENGPKKSYSLKTAVRELYPEQGGYEDGILFSNVDDQLLEYNKKDVQFTYDISKHWFDKLSEKQKRCAAIEAASLPLIAQANLMGMVVDLDAANKLDAELAIVAEDRRTQLEQYGVTEKIIRSPKQLGELIYDQWQLPCTLFTDTGARATNKEALYELSLLDERAKLLKEYREALNNRTKFAQTIIESAEYNEDGKTHPNAFVFGTYSGRLTYSSNQGKGKDLKQTGFGLHQMKRGKDYRQLIAAPEGYTLVEFDAANQEYRWMAIASGDETMMKLCQPGQDAHQYMATQIGNDASRQLGKLANLSLQYRTSAKKLRTVARVQYGLPMELPEAESIHKAYQAAYTQVPVYWKAQIDNTKKDGFVETYAGRRVQMDKKGWRNNEWSMGSTAINYRIQGTGADQKFLALKYIRSYLLSIGGYFAWDLHDGMYFYIPDGVVDVAVHHIKRLLDNLPYQAEWGFSPPIPLPWDCKTGKSWGDLAEYKFESEKDEAGALPTEPPASRSSSSTLHLEEKGSEAILEPIYTDSDNVVQGVDFRRPNEAALEVALKFAAAGMVVFPCLHDKSPVIVGTRVTDKGVTEPVAFAFSRKSSRDPELIRRWFLHDYKDQAAMVGLPCGANNLVVIDPDRPKPEKKKYADGLVLFNNLVSDLSIDLSGVPVIQSPTGGRHYIFSQVGDVRYGCTSGGLPDNIDVKGDNGYVIASGSRRADGIAYEQVVGTASLLDAYRSNTIPQLPDALAEIIGRQKTKTADQNFSGDNPRIAQHLLDTALLPHNIPNDSAFDAREDWIAMAHAIFGASGGTPAGRKAWLAWNIGRDQTPGEPERVWDSIKPDTVRSGSGFIKLQLENRGRLGLLDDINVAEAQSVFSKQGDDSLGKSLISLTPYVRKDPTTLTRREWLYGTHYVKKFTSASVAPGGVGKSSVVMVEAVSMAIGRGLLHEKVKTPLRVWLWNGEDPRDELERRLEAIIQHYQLTDDEIALMEENLWVDTGREQEIKIIVADKSGTKIATPLLKAMTKSVKDNGVDVVVLDPFVSTHAVVENDNSAIDQAAKLWAQLANDTNTSVELVHHVRKTNGAEVTVADARGASAMVDATRAARAFNRMTKDEADNAGVPDMDRWRYFRADDGKFNMSPPTAAQWYMMESIHLPNGDFSQGLDGDSVGAATPWVYTTVAKGMSDGDKGLVIDAMRRATTPLAKASTNANWAGKVVAEALDLNWQENKKAITGILNTLERENKIRVEQIQRPGKRVGETSPHYVVNS